MIINIFKFSTVRCYIFCEFANYIWNSDYYNNGKSELETDNYIELLDRD